MPDYLPVLMDLRRHFRGNELLKHSSILFAASIIAGFLNYLFQVYVGRMLGPSDYGIYSSLVALLYIMSVPSSTIQTSVAKNGLWIWSWSWKDQIPADPHFQKIDPAGDTGFGAFHDIKRLSGRLSQDRFRHVFFYFIYLIFYFFPGTCAGRCPAGFADVRPDGINTVAGTFFKLLFGVALVYLGFGVNGALLALVIGSFLGLLQALIPLRFLKGSKEVKGNISFFSTSLTVLLRLWGSPFCPMLICFLLNII